MKKVYKQLPIITLTVWLLTAASAWANNGQIGIVRIEEVFKKSTYAQQQESSIRARLRQDQSEIESLERDIRTQREQLQSERILSPDSVKYKEKVLRIQIQELQYQDKLQRFTKLNRQNMAEFWRSIYTDFQKAVAHIATSGKFSLIITVTDINLPEQVMNANTPEIVIGAIEQRSVQYYRPDLDITAQVIQVMNAINAKRGSGN